ncbi:SDR family NAD(P)-dependent oxidoreductase [Streptomyces sp. NBC_00243]|uniref:SDR family NAD(P)-dependent oxidoreductase n=1 Tax=Streptomyces sp. NBC_00243 TaxID=2975688 RepID=UPI002DD85613|nr:SDR family NAD(P)-dependent oxidoreductase [Streptomyces sp. NBC_00243]WRZ17809.1 SDR family NAD(P)-dependent oxidoreductase [Streptomyces sp. NBC_00243]
MPHDPTPTAAAVSEPIAIIGMAGRFADAASLDELWKMLLEGRDAITEIPSERYDIDAVYDPTPRTPGRTVSRWGGLLRDIDAFDTEFFGISPREADRMDPQQRLLLETAYEALEDAGQPAAHLAGSDAGVFIGQLGGDYWHLQYEQRDQLDLYAMTGAASRAITSGRLSYAFDLRGPSFTVDTACSSALVAVHNAVQALRLGECRLAIAGGVNVVLLPEEGVVYSGAGMLASDGRCKFADASGDGFVRSDGIGAVILKPLKAALADGDRIRAVIRGSAVGNDGQSSGYLVTPAVEGQRNVVQRAYANAGIDPADVDYIEAHGTGTSVGDPVELQALADVIGPRSKGERCLVGSIKTNIGHAEAAAGIAGLIKAVLCLEHGKVPPNLHLKNPNPAVAWDELPLQIPTQLTALPDRGRPSVAGVSSFGFSGTNAHLVLEAAPTPQAEVRHESPARTELLMLSALSPEALIDTARLMADHLTGAGAAQSLRDICHSAALRRTLHDARLALPVDNHAEAADVLRAFADGQDEPGLSFSDYTDPRTRPRIAFVFPGQGSQWVGMGRQLLETEPVFADAMRACDAAIKTETGWSVIDLLRAGDEERFKELDVIQPTLWAMEIALAQLWRSWGVEPDVVIGHSMGESAAAYIAGSLSLSDAAVVICRRSRLAKRLSGRGTMAWVGLPAEEAARALAGYEDKVAVAAINSPTSTLLSGDGDALAKVLAGLDARGVANRQVNVDFASHCPQMDALREDLLAELAHLAPRPGTIPIHSTLLNEVIDGSAMNADYWVRNIRQPVDFVGAIRGQLALGDTVFIEVSPHPLLVNGIRETGRATGQEVTAVGSLRRQEDERACLLTFVAALHTAGVPLDFAALTGPGQFVPLPSYPWQRTRHWISPAPPADATPAPAAVGTPTPRSATPALAHPLLGTEIAAEGTTRIWQGPLSLQRNAYLQDHRIQDTIILPGTAHLELVAAAAHDVLGGGALSIADVHYHRALFLDESAPPPQVRVVATPADDGSLHCFIYSQDADTDGVEWLLHTEATARPLNAEATAADSLESIRARCGEHQDAADFYLWNAERGNQWNGAFQGVAELWRTDGEVLARLACPTELLDGLGQHHFHPALLDASGHSMAAARPLTASGEEGVFVLGGIDEVRFLGRPTHSMYSHARLLSATREDSFSADIDIRSEDGRLLAQMRGLRLQYLAGHAPAPLTPHREETTVIATAPPAPSITGGQQSWLHTLNWEAAPHNASATDDQPDGFWLVLTDSGPTGRALIRELSGRGERVVAITAAAGRMAGAGDRYRIDPANPGHYSDTLADIAREGTCRGVIHLWALDAQAGLDATATEIGRTQLLAGHSVLHLIRALDKHHLGHPPLWLITQLAQATSGQDTIRNPFQAPLWGLGRTLAAETPALAPRLVDLDRSPASISALADLLAKPDAEDQTALRNGRRFAARLRPAPAAAGAPQNLSLPTPGVLDDLQLQPAPHRQLGPDDVRIQVAHAGVNYRDVLLSLGMYPGQDNQPPMLGWECAGAVTEIGGNVTDVGVGDEVIAFAEGALASEVVTLACLTAPKPARLNSAQAATLPASYLTAYHALHDLARIDRGDKILIHSATGGTGLAALNVARWKGARVYATAGSDAKRQLLAKFGVGHVSDSRSLDFADTFRPAPGEAGFDVILNTLAGEAIPANLSLMAPYGHYLELSKRDILDDNPLHLGPFARNLSFHAVDVVHMIQNAPERAGRILRAAAALVDRGDLQPLPHTEFPASEAADAFRLMAQSRHTGKIVLSFSTAATTPAAARTPAVAIHGDGTYLVTGGAGGIGGRLALWLADQGARHLLLTGRSPLPAPGTPLPDDHPHAAAITVIEELTRRGVSVQYAAADVADYHGMRELLTGRHRQGLPPLRGVFHAAGVIDYTPLSDMTPADLDTVLAAKVSGAWNLHRLLHDQEVDTFVLFSSGSALLSSPMLGGYAAGNAFLDALAHYRHATGHPATVVNWGFWDSVGMVARKEEEEERTLLPQGMASFSPAEGLSVLGSILSQGRLQTAVLRADWPAWAQAYPAAATAPLLQHLTTPGRPNRPAPAAPITVAPAPATSEQPALSEQPLAPKAAPTPTPPQAAQAPTAQSATPAPAPAADAPSTDLLESVKREAAIVMGLRPERLNVNRPLNRLGMDSLMAVELRNRIERQYRVKLPMVQLLKDGTITTVVQALAAELNPANTPAAQPDVTPAPTTVAATNTAQLPAQKAAEPERPDIEPAEPQPTAADAPPSADEEVLAFVKQQVAVVMGVRLERLNVNRPLNRLGMDSLMAVELRNRIEREYRVKLPMVQLLKDGTITTVVQALAAELNSANAPA